MRALAHRIVHARNFEYLLVVLIIGSAVLLGLSTSDKLADQYLIWMGLFWILTILVLILEVLLKRLRFCQGSTVISGMAGIRSIF